jgi:hypothetical protein
MALKVDYYTSLLRAVGDLDRDAYAARGAIYEREHKALMRLLFSADPPRSEAEIEREQAAFREAVRRVEFGNDENDITLAPFSVPPRPIPVPSATAGTAAAAASPRTVPPAGAPATAAFLRPVTASAVSSAPAAAFAPQPPTARDRLVPLHPSAGSGTEAGAGAPPLAPEEPGTSGAGAAGPRRRPMVGFIARRMTLAVVLVALGALGYGHATGEFQLPWLAGLVSDGTVLHLARESDAQQAIVFDSEGVNPGESHAMGNAVWRMRPDPDARAGRGLPLIELAAEIPERRLALRMSMHREPAGSAMSQLAEFQFIRPDQQPDGDIGNIGSLYMTSADGLRRAPLFGRVIRVAPGVFLFGMAGGETEREQNQRNMKDLPWIAIPLIYRNGFYGTLIVEKGPPGERLFNEVLAKWAQGS